MNYGLIIQPPSDTDFIFGDNKLLDSPILPSADWSPFLPVFQETQDSNGFEPACCVPEATTHCVETLLRQEYGATNDLSVRFLAKLSDTDKNNGASPQTVAQNLSNKGCADELDYPFKCSNFAEFYQTLPKWLMVKALELTTQYSIGYSFVPSNVDALKKALTYSPVVFSTYAWVKDENGFYFRPQGETDNHAVMLYGYADGQYWKIYDSYSADGVLVKKVRWDSLPMQAMRLTTHRQIVSESGWQKFLYWITRVINSMRYA